MYYMHNEQLFVNLANWHEVWAEYREFQVYSERCWRCARIVFECLASSK
jgi:hypothetical protein